MPAQSGIWGADPDALDALAGEFRSAAAQLRALEAGLRSRIHIAPWMGVHADAFRLDWDVRQRQALLAGVEQLSSVATVLVANAADQRQASAAHASASGASGTGPEENVDLDPETVCGTNGEDVRNHYLDLAYRDAGIDPSKWDPSRGSQANREWIVNSYEYYGDLFLQNPHLQWAGMANIMGPAFASGFYDIATIRDAARVLAVAGVVGPLRVQPGLALLAVASDEDLRFYETTFLQMQKDIFDDAMMMHEAYLNDGMTGIDRLYNNGLIDQVTRDGWAMIDQGRAVGNEAMIEAGNERLLYREQNSIVAASYDAMRSHPPTGEAFTYVLTAIGSPPVPGAHTFAQVFPLTTHQESPGFTNIPGTNWDNPFQGSVDVKTPLPNGNIADSGDRWDLITKDTLPAYQEDLRDRPESITDIIRTPVEDRIDDQRLRHQVDDIAGRLGPSQWKVTVSQ